MYIESIKILYHDTIGYSGSGVFPKRDIYLYKVKARNSDKIYTISTSKKLYQEDLIRASVKGTKMFRGEEQTQLSRVEILIPGRFRKDRDFSELNGRIIASESKGKGC